MGVFFCSFMGFVSEKIKKEEGQIHYLSQGKIIMKTKIGKETMEDETISRADRRRRLPWIKCGNPGDRKIISPEGNRSGRHM